MNARHGTFFVDRFIIYTIIRHFMPMLFRFQKNR